MKSQKVLKKIIIGVGVAFGLFVLLFIAFGEGTEAQAQAQAEAARIILEEHKDRIISELEGYEVRFRENPARLVRRRR